MNPNDTPFAAQVNGNIKAELARRGISSSEVAGQIGKSVDAVQRRLSGKQEWTLSDIGAIARMLGVDTSVLTA